MNTNQSFQSQYQGYYNFNNSNHYNQLQPSIIPNHQNYQPQQNNPTNFNPYQKIIDELNFYKDNYQKYCQCYQQLYVKNNELEKEIQGLKALLDQATNSQILANTNITNLKQQVQKLTTENASLHKIIENMSVPNQLIIQKQMTSSLKKEIEILNTQKNQLSKENDILKSENENYNNQIHKLIDENENLQKKLKEANNENSTLTMNNESISNEKTELNDEIKNLKETISNKQQQIDDLNKLNRDLNTKNDLLTKDKKKMGKLITFQKEIILKQMILAKNENELQIRRIREMNNDEIKAIFETIL